MFYNEKDWVIVSGDQLHVYMGELGFVENEDMDFSTVEMSWVSLPFYTKIVLLRVRNLDDNENPIDDDDPYFLTNGSSFHFLNGDNYQITSINDRISFSLGEEDVLEYLRFYLFFSDIDESEEFTEQINTFFSSEDDELEKQRYLVADSPDLPYIPEDTDVSALQKIKELAPPVITKADSYDDEDEQGYLCTLPTLFNGKLVECRFFVSEAGNVETVWTAGIC